MGGWVHCKENVKTISEITQVNWSCHVVLKEESDLCDETQILFILKVRRYSVNRWGITAKLNRYFSAYRTLYGINIPCLVTLPLAHLFGTCDLRKRRSIGIVKYVFSLLALISGIKTLVRSGNINFISHWGFGCYQPLVLYVIQTAMPSPRILSNFALVS